MGQHPALMPVARMAGASSGTQNADASEKLARLGLVFAYGCRVYPPYAFNGADTDTLFLNGYSYSPTLSKRGESRAIRMSETCRTQHQLDATALGLCRNGQDRAERVRIYVDTLRASPLVDSVRLVGDSVYMRWDGEVEEEEVVLPWNDSLFDRAAFHEILIEEFWRTVGSGGLVAFGERYHVLSPRDCVAQIRHLLERIALGEYPTVEDVRDTALEDTRFLTDLWEHRATAGLVAVPRR